MERKKEVRRYLRSTMEVKLLVRNALLYLVIDLVFALISGVLLYQSVGVWQAEMLAPGIIIIPYLLWFLVRYARIMAKADHYCFYRAKLDTPKPSPWIRDRFYFTVALDEEDGNITVVDTHGVFHARGVLWPQMDRCLNQNVGIAYNPETKMVVVTG